MAAHDPRLLHYWAPGCQNSAQPNYTHRVLDSANKSVWICASSQEQNYLQKKQSMQETECLYEATITDIYSKNVSHG